MARPPLCGSPKRRRPGRHKIRVTTPNPVSADGCRLRIYNRLRSSTKDIDVPSRLGTGDETPANRVVHLMQPPIFTVARGPGWAACEIRDTKEDGYVNRGCKSRSRPKRIRTVSRVSRPGSVGRPRRISASGRRFGSRLREVLREVVAELTAAPPPPVPSASSLKSETFCAGSTHDNFTFLGYSELRRSTERPKPERGR